MTQGRIKGRDDTVPYRAHSILICENPALKETHSHHRALGPSPALHTMERKRCVRESDYVNRMSF